MYGSSVYRSPQDSLIAFFTSVAFPSDHRLMKLGLNPERERGREGERTIPHKSRETREIDSGESIDSLAA